MEVSLLEMKALQDNIDQAAVTSTIKQQPQIKEIMNACLCSVFFIDESQRVTLSDIGSIAEIRKWAKELNSEVSELELLSQFRCNGSDGYLAWLDDVLEIRQTANNDGFDIDYDIQIMDNPNDVKDKIFELNKINNKEKQDYEKNFINRYSGSIVHIVMWRKRIE